VERKQAKSVRYIERDRVCVCVFLCVCVKYEGRAALSVSSANVMILSFALCVRAGTKLSSTIIITTQTSCRR